MSDSTKRSVTRWLHILLGFPVIGYIYSPFEALPHFAPVVRFFFLPVLILSGFWLWKGHALRQFITKRSSQSGKSSTTFGKQ